jgi:hypothetical protein
MPRLPAAHASNWRYPSARGTSSTFLPVRYIMMPDNQPLRIFPIVQRVASERYHVPSASLKGCRSLPISQQSQQHPRQTTPQSIISGSGTRAMHSGRDEVHFISGGLALNSP